MEKEWYRIANNLVSDEDINNLYYKYLSEFDEEVNKYFKDDYLGENEDFIERVTKKNLKHFENFLEVKNE